ncbi:MAG TPA: hypothetical protein VGC99_11965 [Candidatus Tectomicrobia bacterium]
MLSRGAKVAQGLLGEQFWGGGHRSLERLYLVSHVATAVLLGASVAGNGSHDRTRRQVLWTFVRQADMGPTHNTAERAIRPGGRGRQGSFATHSAAGSRFVDARMTVVATLKQQHRHVFDYLTAACQAALHASPTLS